MLEKSVLKIRVLRYQKYPRIHTDLCEGHFSLKNSFV